METRGNRRCHSRVELLQFENRPLAQLLYEGEHGVVVLCIMPDSDGRSEREAERRVELNTVYWASEDHRFLLLGPVSVEAMEKMADLSRAASLREPTTFCAVNVRFGS